MPLGGAAELSSEKITTSTRDTGDLGRAIERWMATVLPDGAEPTVTNVVKPEGNGMSSETILFDAAWTIVNRAVDAALAAVKPGDPARLVDKAARDVITEAGYGDRFPHRTGHGLGIDVHEEPYITGTSRRPLEVGNVFSIEPGVYLTGRFGIRVEDIVILRPDHAEVLSELPRDIFRCG